MQNFWGAEREAINGICAGVEKAIKERRLSIIHDIREYPIPRGTKQTVRMCGL